MATNGTKNRRRRHSAFPDQNKRTSKLIPIDGRIRRTHTYSLIRHCYSMFMWSIQSILFSSVTRVPLNNTWTERPQSSSPLNYQWVKEISHIPLFDFEKKEPGQSQILLNIPKVPIPLDQVRMGRGDTPRYLPPCQSTYPLPSRVRMGGGDSSWISYRNHLEVNSLLRLWVNRVFPKIDHSVTLPDLYWLNILLNQLFN